MAQVRGEERHLVGARDEHLLGGDYLRDELIDGAARDLARGLLDVQVVGRERGLELALVEREQRRRAAAVAVVGRFRVHAAVFLARGRL